MSGGRTYAKVTGVGGYMPADTVDNVELGARFGVETSDEWIKSRTGISRRHLAAEDESVCDMSYKASCEALSQANITGADLDMIVLATTTPDRIYPATACLLQHQLGAAPCAAFDVQAVCSGFLYALATAEAMIAAGRAKTVLAVGAEVFSATLDWQDRSTCVLFGDGAGAVVLSASSTPGVLSVNLHADGQYADKLTVKARLRGGKLEGDPYTRMDGGTVFRFAVLKMAESALQAIEEGGRQPDWLVLHQANSRIIESVRKRLDIPLEKCVNCVDECANTSAASIPLALARFAPKFSPGDVILLAAVGGGFAWGAALIEW